MTTHKSSDCLSFEEALQDPTLAHLHEVIHFLEDNEDKILFPKKYMTGLKSLVSRDIKSLFIENPNRTISKVVVTILDSLNDKLPSEMVLEITSFIIKKWENLSASSLNKTSVLQPVG